MTLQSITRPLESVYDNSKKKQSKAIPHGNLCAVWRRLPEKTSLEKVLLRGLRLGCLERTQSAAESAMKFFVLGNRRYCVYCGDPADSRDHLIAVSYNRDSRDYAFQSRLLGPVVWSCRDCNLRLGNRWFDSFDDRCRYMRDLLHKKAKGIHWTQKQINALDISLRSYIQPRVNLSRWFRYRSEWYESSDYIHNIESLEWRVFSDEFSVRYFAPTIALIKLHYVSWGKSHHAW